MHAAGCMRAAFDSGHHRLCIWIPSVLLCACYLWHLYLHVQLARLKGLYQENGRLGGSVWFASSVKAHAYYACTTGL
jgi:hypothetical protein